MKYIYRYWIIAPLLLLAILSRNWVEDPAGEPIETTIDMRASQADYYLEAFETRKFDVEGNPQYVMKGDTLSHYPEDDRSVIVEPRLVVYRNDVVWQMSSPRGVFTPQPDTFVLDGEVSMLRSGSGSDEDVKLETSNVVVMTEANKVTTDQPITVTAENWQLRSIGLESNIDDGTLKLLSNVTARYETK